ncbi:hypothetical protein LSAT2_016287 [Lamellibrachia satsuma]|nr:hypothetical protein LSAT2_016287 [Lamellibrachia satsuma]
MDLMFLLDYVLLMTCACAVSSRQYCSGSRKWSGFKEMFRKTYSSKQMQIRGTTSQRRQDTPFEWKEANIIPLFKKGDEQELANLVERLEKTSTSYRMEISAEKTKLMTNNTQGITTEVKVNGQRLETVTSFRCQMWKIAERRVTRHNLLFKWGIFTYTSGTNEYADLTSVEYKKYMLGLKVPKNTIRCRHPCTRASRMSYRVAVFRLPASVDWRSRGYVTPVKNQVISCCACAHASVRALVYLCVSGVVDASVFGV